MEKFEKERKFIERMQGGVLLKDYTLEEVCWFMKNYKDDEIEKEYYRNQPKSKIL